MNDTREKLIEILRVPIHPHLDADPAEVVADFLIANGVTFATDNNDGCKWIPVTERLPENDGIYLTFNKKKQYEFHFFQRGKSMWPAIWEEDAVTHWMSLPEPPKEDNHGRS